MMEDVLWLVFTDLTWQDLIVSVGQVVFVFALWPMLRSSTKPPLLTSILHGLILSSFGVVFASLGLWFSTVAVTVGSGMWFYLGWQKFGQNDGPSE